MPLQQVIPTKIVIANQIAQRIIQEVTQTALRVNHVRTVGVLASPEQPPREGPNGQMIPAIPGTPAISPEAINAAIGEANCAILDQIKTALGL